MNQSRIVITPSSRARPWAAALSALIWITLCLRLGLAVQEHWRAGEPLFWALGSFGYFTVLTTLNVVALLGLFAVLGLGLIGVSRRWGRAKWFS